MRLGVGAYDSGDFDRADRSVRETRQRLGRMRAYGPAAAGNVAEADGRLAELSERLGQRDLAGEEVKEAYCMAYEALAGPTDGTGRPDKPPKKGRAGRGR